MSNNVIAFPLPYRNRSTDPYDFSHLPSVEDSDATVVTISGEEAHYEVDPIELLNSLLVTPEEDMDLESTTNTIDSIQECVYRPLLKKYIDCPIDGSDFGTKYKQWRVSTESLSLNRFNLVVLALIPDNSTRTCVIYRFMRK